MERSWGRYLTKCLSLRSIFDASLKFILSLVNFQPFDLFFLQLDIFKCGLWWPSNNSSKDVWIFYIHCLYCPPNHLLLSYCVFFPETSTHDMLENELREDLFAKKFNLRPKKTIHQNRPIETWTLGGKCVVLFVVFSFKIFPFSRDIFSFSLEYLFRCQSSFVPTLVSEWVIHSWLAFQITSNFLFGGCMRSDILVYNL